MPGSQKLPLDRTGASEYGQHALEESGVGDAELTNAMPADTFTGANVSAIVLQFPSADLLTACGATNDVVGVWAAAFALCRYVSVGSLTAAVAIPLSQTFAHRPAGEIALGALLAAVIIVRHRRNIQRLLAGTEHRAWTKK